jgi:hypothetical protein
VKRRSTSSVGSGNLGRGSVMIQWYVEPESRFQCPRAAKPSLLPFIRHFLPPRREACGRQGWARTVSRIVAQYRHELYRAPSYLSQSYQLFEFCNAPIVFKRQIRLILPKKCSSAGSWLQGQERRRRRPGYSVGKRVNGCGPAMFECLSLTFQRDYSLSNTTGGPSLQDRRT